MGGSRSVYKHTVVFENPSSQWYGFLGKVVRHSICGLEYMGRLESADFLAGKTVQD